MTWHDRSLCKKCSRKQMTRLSNGGGSDITYMILVLRLWFTLMCHFIYSHCYISQPFFCVHLCFWFNISPCVCILCVCSLMSVPVCPVFCLRQPLAFHLSPFQCLPMLPHGMFPVFCPSCFYWVVLCSSKLLRVYFCASWFSDYFSFFLLPEFTFCSVSCLLLVFCIWAINISLP